MHAKWVSGRRQPKEQRDRASRNWNISLKAAEAKQRWRQKDPKRAWAVYATGGAKERAYRRGLLFDLDKEYVLSITPDNCPVFNTPFSFIGNKHIIDASASLDRIDPSKGYVRGNVVVISMKANAIKNAYTAEDILAVGNWLKGTINERHANQAGPEGR